MEVASLLIFFIGLSIGFAVAWWLRRPSSTADVKETVDQSTIIEENARMKERLDNSILHFNEQKVQLKSSQEKIIELTAELANWKTKHGGLEERLGQQKEEVEEVRQQFKKDFQLLAGEILKANSEEFSKANRQKLDEILLPLKEKLKSFEESVEKKYVDETKERSALQEQIKQLMDLNHSLSTEAQNLTKALKGDNKAQGNWGEVILERILESSGLKKDEEYFTQFNDKNQEGRTIRPDVVVQLPDEKHIVIDSKVSLLAYEAFSSSENEVEREQHLKDHLLSVRNHVKGLSEKNYQSGGNINSPDFVLLFMPLEPSFSLALQADQQLYAYAWDRKVVIVSPTTLLATLRTIASIWNQERQSKNVQEIANRAGKLYDKFANFVADMQKIDQHLGKSRDAYEEAFKKLSSGNGNLVVQVEKLKELGAKTNKQLPKELMDEPEQKQLDE